MTANESREAYVWRDFLCSRIIAGINRITVGKREYILRPNTAMDKYCANVLYQEYYEQAVRSGVITQQEVEDNEWSEEKEHLLEKYNKDIEDFKVSLVDLYFKTNELLRVKKYLNEAKSRVSALLSERYKMNYVTAEGLASQYKTFYLIAVALHDINGNKLYTDKNWARIDYKLLNSAISQLNSNAISDQIIRELSRTEPWRSYWSARKYGSLFDCPISNYTDEQRLIVFWSSLYDSVYEHSECPPNQIIEDDDILDGWLIKQSRKRKSDMDRTFGESLISGNKKINEADEVFVVVDTPEDAKRIYSMNDSASRATSKARFKWLQQSGEIAEQNMPDTKREIMMKLNQMEKQARIGK